VNLGVLIAVYFHVIDGAYASEQGQFVHRARATAMKAMKVRRRFETRGHRGQPLVLPPNDPTLREMQTGRREWLAVRSLPV
jgi:hypothetical protein